jgi:hypothetical protein
MPIAEIIPPQSAHLRENVDQDKCKLSCYAHYSDHTAQDGQGPSYYKHEKYRSGEMNFFPLEKTGLLPRKALLRCIITFAVDTAPLHSLLADQFTYS